MPNLNLATSLLLSFLISIFATNYSYSQTQQSLPVDLQNISINSRALEKNFQFTVDSNSSQFSQNFSLDKTGFILHLQPSPKIKDDKTKIKMISEDGKEIETFTLEDGTLFGLVDPNKNYSIIQEIKPVCSNLARAFNFNEASIICPGSVAFKIHTNIMLTEDTSFLITLRPLSEFYTIKLTLPVETTFLTNSNFNHVQIQKPNEENLNIEQTEETEQKSNTNIANLLKVGEVCFSSSTKTKPNKKEIKCDFSNKNTQAIIKFKNDLKNKDTSSQNTTLVYPFLPSLFTNLNHNYFFNFTQSVQTENKAQEINKKSVEKFFLENYNSNLTLNLGKIPITRTRIKKNIYNLNSPIEINKTLNKTNIQIPFNKFEAIINPFSDTSADSVLTNLSITGKDKNLLTSFNISIDNNIILKNSQEPDNETTSTRRLQTTTQDNLDIISYFPEGTFDLTLNKTYSLIEQNIAPSVDDKGKPTKIINNKSKADLVLSKTYPANDLINPLVLDYDKSSSLLNDPQFKGQLSLSGFLIPPDFRPVLEPNYRATISASMTIKLKGEESVNIIYSDLKTKDETPLTNFFKFSFLPQGQYDTNLKFDGERKKLFEATGLLIKDKL